MTALALGAFAACGAWLAVGGAEHRRTGPATSPRRGRRLDDWLAQAGLAGVDRAPLVGASLATALLAATAAVALFGGVLAPLVAGGLGAAAPAATLRRRRRTRRAVAMDAWPRLIEEIRVLTAAAGRSIPQALLEAGGRAPVELRPAFAAARRTWLLTTDLERTLSVLKAQLADPTCDVTCETLLVAHQLGGADVDRRLAALAEDRRLDAQCRKDARARQAGVRFARRFVLLVPLGMAAAGLSVGDGRAAYQTPHGQVAVVCGLVMVAGCWLWAGHILRLPEEQRVFDR